MQKARLKKLRFSATVNFGMGLIGKIERKILRKIGSIGYQRQRLKEIYAEIKMLMKSLRLKDGLF